MLELCTFASVYGVFGGAAQRGSLREYGAASASDPEAV